MSEITYYEGKVAECLKLARISEDPLLRDVYQAMAAEFVDKLAAAGQYTRSAAMLSLADA